MKQAILSLLSDFGEQDIYVGVIKGVILQINPHIQIVDLTHKIAPQNIIAASFCLMNAYPYLPIGTIHLAVVDPGVGSTRRSIAIQLAQGYFVGPDNGIFTGIISQNQIINVVELTNINYWLTSTPSTTFHGRDIFAPVAAHLASGTSLLELGRPIDPQTLVKLNIAECQIINNTIFGCIQYIDYFGNLVSNIPASYVQNQNWCVKITDITILGYATYSDVKFGENLALIGSHGWVEIAVNGGNAHQKLGIDWQDKLTIHFL